MIVLWRPLSLFKLIVIVHEHRWLLLKARLLGLEVSGWHRCKAISRDRRSLLVITWMTRRLRARERLRLSPTKVIKEWALDFSSILLWESLKVIRVLACICITHHISLPLHILKLGHFFGKALLQSLRLLLLIFMEAWLLVMSALPCIVYILNLIWSNPSW